MACPKCGMAVVRARSGDHQKYTCLKRMVPCPKCLQMVMVGDLPVLHLEHECPRRLRDCDQGCGLQVPMTDMEEHCRRDCKNKPQPCCFHGLGCEDLVSPPNQASHNQDHLRAHVDMLLVALARVQSEAARQVAQAHQELEGLARAAAETARQLDLVRADQHREAEQAATELKAETARQLEQLKAAHRRDLQEAAAATARQFEQLKSAFQQQLQQAAAEQKAALQQQAVETARQVDQLRAAHQRDLQQAAAEQKAASSNKPSSSGPHTNGICSRPREQKRPPAAQAAASR
eukprot:GAFH01001464.1.p3 GENE.GAFH01001464.1~~GAFH01001464.1.p3  ORF type:complete len:316 (+),score=60.41 GAFH01001464.1:81-950(+)